MSEGHDLRHADLTKKVMFGEDLRGKKLYGAKIKLVCQQFDGAKVDDDQMALLLMMVSLLDSPGEWSTRIRHVVEAQVGQERYQTYLTYLRLA